MNLLDLRKYGIPLTINLEGEFIEFPATAADPLSAPLVILVDENHDLFNLPAVVANARDVAQIAKAIPKVVVVLEHFLSGEIVTAHSESGYIIPGFHRYLLEM